MCTLVVNFDPTRRHPVALVAVRDELLDRPWDPPARHWPDRSGLIGGRDRLAGGTWLAYHPAAHRVACVLNGTGRSAPATGRRSRGELPLLAADGAPVPAELAGYDPFHLVLADPTGLRVLTWNGYQPHRHTLPAGTWLFVNAGLWSGPADRRSPRATHFGPLFAAARPDPAPDGPVTTAWAPWAGLVDEPDVPPGDPRALLVRPVDGWGTSSVTLLAFGAEGDRYDFRAGPEPGPWQPVRTG